jgi:hypothetical protein
MACRGTRAGREPAPKIALMDSQFVSGLGLSGISFFGRYAVAGIPKPIAWAGVIAGATMMLFSGTKPPASSIIFAVIGILCLGAAIHFYLARDIDGGVSTGGTDDQKVFRQQRTQKELANRDARGEPISLRFGENGISSMPVKDGENTYNIGVNRARRDTTWLAYPQQEASSFSIVRSAERGKPVDMRLLRPVRGDYDAIEIGNRIFLSLKNGKTLQLILVGVLNFSVGDDVDEVRFKYKVYDAGVFFIDAL